MKSGGVRFKEMAESLVVGHNFPGTPLCGNRLRLGLRRFVEVRFTATWARRNLGIVVRHIVQKCGERLATTPAQSIKILIVRHRPTPLRNSFRSV